MTVSHPQGSPGQFSASAWEVLRHRYLRKNAAGEIVETPEEMFRRVARTVAGVEANHIIKMWRSGKTPSFT
jgi:ribonucleotide reductase alpha subunit